MSGPLPRQTAEHEPSRPSGERSRRRWVPDGGSGSPHHVPSLPEGVPEEGPPLQLHRAGLKETWRTVKVIGQTSRGAELRVARVRGAWPGEQRMVKCGYRPRGRFAGRIRAETCSDRPLEPGERR